MICLSSFKRLALVLLSVLLLSIVFFICYKIVEYPFFFISDQHDHFLTIQNKNFFWLPGQGRFFPLWSVEFYYVLTSSFQIKDIIYGVYTIQAAKFVLFCLFYFIILKKVSNFAMAGVGFLVFLACSAPVSFLQTISHTIFPESILILTLTLFILCYLIAIKTNRLFYFILSLLFATYSLYLKEPVVAVFITFVFANCFSRLAILSNKEKLFLLFLGIDSLIFVLLYYFLAYSDVNYATSRIDANRIEMIKVLFLSIYFIPISYFFFLVRIVQVLFFKFKIVLADTLLAMACAYSFCFIILNFYAPYYLIPSYILFFVALVNYCYLFNHFLFSIFDFKKQFTKVYNTLLFLIALSITFVFCFIFYNYISNFDFYKQAKIYTKYMIEALVELNSFSVPYVSYLPSSDTFQKEIYYSLAYHPLYSTAVFYNFYLKNLKHPNDSIITNDELFLKQIDMNSIGQLSLAHSDYLPLWANNYEYRELKFGFFSFLYKSDNQNIKDAYCRFASKIQSEYGNDFKNINKPIFLNAVQLACNENKLDTTSSFSFQSGQQGEFLLGTGWSTAESWGVWSDGAVSVLEIPSYVFKKELTQDINCSLDVTSFGQQIVTIMNNTGAVLWHGNLFGNLKINFIIPFENNSSVILKFKILNPTSPHSLGISEDLRKLGIGLKKLSFE